MTDAGPPPGCCDLWLVPTSRLADRLDLLDLAERERAAGLGRKTQDTFVTSRALQRLVCAAYLGVAPGTVRFSRTCGRCGAGHGRPRIVGGGPDYSVSHTAAFVVLAAVGHGLVGVDLEDGASLRDPGASAPIMLTPAELAAHAAEAPDRRWTSLLTAWARKEAAAKLTGLGLRVPPTELDVSGPLARTTVEVAGWPYDVAVRLSALPAPAGHVAALATSEPLRRLRRRALPAAASACHAGVA